MKMAADLVDAVERFFEAKMLNDRLRNRESALALDKARSALVEEFGEKREAA
jgi:hypothetical protein